MDNLPELRPGVKRKREILPQKKVEIPEDCWLEVLKFLACSQWTEKRLVSWQINAIAERNIFHLPCAVLERAIFEEDGYCIERELARKILIDHIVSNEVQIPASEIMTWFADRSITLGTPEDKEEELLGEKDWEYTTINMLVLGPAQRFEDMRYHTL
ncbi:hypothetical protein Ddc_19141 [Ditylenchus destructor]|nr:hypothetical protein Ddc_19141 [Ditylenchus destructor]